MPNAAFSAYMGEFLMSLAKQSALFGRVVLGGLMIAFGIQFFLVPNNLVIGGVSGFAIILNHLTGLPTGLLFFLINAPVFIFALRQFGFRFILISMLGIITTSILIDLIAFWGFTATNELILVAIFGGLLIGAGVGLIISVGSSAGAVDMLARLLQVKRPDLTLGHLILCIDGTIILIGALVFQQIDLALYAVISVYILKRTIDAILSRSGAQPKT